jgi:hypothetical protein
MTHKTPAQVNRQIAQPLPDEYSFFGLGTLLYYFLEEIENIGIMNVISGIIREKIQTERR